MHYREEITIGKITLAVAEGGESITTIPEGQIRLAEHRQLRVPVDYDGEADSNIPTVQFTLPLPATAADAPDLANADSGYGLRWRGNIYRVISIDRDPINLVMRIKCALSRRDKDAD